MDVEIGRVEDKVFSVVFSDDLEAIVLWHADADQRFVNDGADRFPVNSLLAFAQIDANERHGLVS
jgi:hypothetical protein